MVGNYFLRVDCTERFAGKGELAFGFTKHGARLAEWGTGGSTLIFLVAFVGFRATWAPAWPPHRAESIAPARRRIKSRQPFGGCSVKSRRMKSRKRMRRSADAPLRD